MSGWFKRLQKFQLNYRSNAREVNDIDKLPRYRFTPSILRPVYAMESAWRNHQTTHAQLFKGSSRGGQKIHNS